MNIQNYNRHIIQCIREDVNKQIYVKIQRYDGFYFKASDNTFSQTDTGFISLGETDPSKPWDVSFTLTLNPNFKDGDYTVYYHVAYPDHVSVIPFKADQFSIIRGTTAPQIVPTTTEIALRLMDIKIGNTTMRKTLEKINLIHDLLKKSNNIYNRR